MKTLSEVLRDSGLSYQTLVKYTQMGLVPKPERVWGGRGKGSQSFFPDDVIERIERVRSKQESGLTLAEIAENVRPERKTKESTVAGGKAVVPENPMIMRDYIRAMPELFQQVERENPGYRLHTIRLVSIGSEGRRSLVPVEMVVVPK